MRESRTCGSVRGARDETRVPTAPGVDGPLRHLGCQNTGWSETTGEQGAIHERDYDEWVRFLAAWHTHQAVAEALHIELAFVASPVCGFGRLPADQLATVPRE